MRQFVLNLFFLLSGFVVFASASDRKPNLIVIETDEHNFRTLGCYRETLPPDQAYVWGKGVAVETPNIDSLAKDGAICTSFYASSPVCTPSRASLVSGLYPQATGSPSNDLPLHDDIVTFAEVLKRNGYATSYLGKWHLDGPAKPGFAPERKFGFDDNRYMFNRGHWKQLLDMPEGLSLVPEAKKKGKLRYTIEGVTEERFTTDFLIDRAVEILERDKDKPFCMMISIPDPHGPNLVRPPYDTMYDHFVFEQPKTMKQTLAKLAKRPRWNQPKGSNAVTKLNQAQFADYFGMVKCIDDNVGKLLRYLDENGLKENTAVVFTSDHGDMMCEHCRLNKGLPYETSAKIPFVIRFPGRIPAGKVIEKAYTTVDFSPTVLGLLGIEGELPAYHGIDASADFAGEGQVVSGGRVVYVRNAGGQWVAAIDSRYKLVLSVLDKPWLYDLQKDPDELINWWGKPGYVEIGQRLKDELISQMKEYSEPIYEKGNLIYE